MNSSRYHRPTPAPAADNDRMWPLDLSLIALAGLVLYLIVAKLSFEDPRWLFNAWTYAVAVPMIALILAILLRSIASKYVQKSIQLGFLFSVCVHLLLLILAFNVIVFSSYLPTAAKGKKPERSPERRTVPEHLFHAPSQRAETPDWSQPADAQTASRVLPKEQRQLPPVQRSEPKLQMPKPKEIEQQRPLKKMLMKREQFTPTQPMPADAPGKLARRERQQDSPKPSARPIQVPSAKPTPRQNAEASPSERQISKQPRRQSSAARAPAQPETASFTPDLSPRPLPNTPTVASRSRSEALPKIGNMGVTRRERQRARPNRSRPAASAPTPPTIAVARESVDASLKLSPVQTPVNRRGSTSGAQITAGLAPGAATQAAREPTVGAAEFSRSENSAMAGAPSVSAGNSPRLPGRSNNTNRGQGFAPAGAPTAADAMAASTGIDGTGSADSVDDRMGDLDVSRIEMAAGRSGSNSPTLSQDGGGPSLALDVLAPVGPVGLADLVSPSSGVTVSEDQPKIAALEISRAARPKRESGGPATPAGAEVAAVESFSRRVMRTKGGAPAAAAGFAGPATEEAIELGLQYLASTQNPDGSWSLQGHGADVVLRSDTAATGLCLLAFQGAGYTHLQHQHADTVSRGLKFLMDNQRSSGSLYRSENPVSDRNVAFYSHGIAALAMSEAYGMTQDRDLRESAQGAIRYIVATQHHKRGGWRYSPQISSDTSVSGWMMMALKSGELSGLDVPKETYDGITHWLDLAQQNKDRPDRYRYNPYAPDTVEQRHGRIPSPTMTSVGMLMRMYSGWKRDNKSMKSAADYLLENKPSLGTARLPKRDSYYWYYATQVMFHMGGDYWEQWNQALNPILLRGQVTEGPRTGSWDPRGPIPDQWAPHAGRLYVTTMNLLNLEVYYRHLPIYEETAE